MPLQFEMKSKFFLKAAFNFQLYVRRISRNSYAKIILHAILHYFLFISTQNLSMSVKMKFDLEMTLSDLEMTFKFQPNFRLWHQYLDNVPTMCENLTYKYKLPKQQISQVYEHFIANLCGFKPIFIKYPDSVKSRLRGSQNFLRHQRMRKIHGLAIPISCQNLKEIVRAV